MMFYLAKNRYHIFYKKAGLGWQYEIKNGTIYAFKLLRYRIGIDDIDFSLAYIVKESGAIKLILKSYKINETGEMIVKYRNSSKIMNEKTNTRGIFENNNEHFYFLTYTDTFNFASGYFDFTNNIDNINFQENLISKNEVSPLEFIDEVEIEYIKFIHNYKYAYYKINNLVNNLSWDNRYQNK